MQEKETRTRHDWNGREYTPKMQQHLEAVRPKHGENGFANPNGRPTKQQEIKNYRNQHPDSTKYRCHLDTGIDRNTIRKWWDS